MASFKSEYFLFPKMEVPPYEPPAQENLHQILLDLQEELLILRKINDKLTNENTELKKKLQDLENTKEKATKETKQPEPKQPEPKQPEPKQPEPKQPEPKQPEQSQYYNNYISYLQYPMYYNTASGNYIISNNTASGNYVIGNNIMIGNNAGGLRL